MTPSQTSVTRRLRLGSDPKLRRRYMVVDEPLMSNIRVGLLLEVLDKLAETTALRFVRKVDSRARVVTAAMDDLHVCAAPDIEYDMLLRARINFVGRTSLEVGIRIEQDGPERVHLGACYFTMVARLEDGEGERSVPLPSLEYLSVTDKRRSQSAQERREARRKPKTSEPAPEELAFLYRLHRRLDEAPVPPILARDLVTSGWERTYPEYENVPKKIFGGYVAHRAYMYSHICAELVANSRAILVASERIDFYQPVRMGDKLHFVSRVTYTGHTSIRVETAITRISRDRSMSALSNTCVFTFVNADARLNLLPVPPIYPTSYAEDVNYLAGYRHHQLRSLARTKRAPRSGSPHLSRH